MMGSGKSSVGKSLSERLNMNFVDTDILIEEKLSLSIAKIFETKGEKFFRKIEEEEVLKIIKKEGCVVALGGGAFINNIIRENIKKNCFSVWIKLNINKIFERTKNNQKRPLLKDNSKEELVGLYNQRKDIYSLADYTIDCNDKDKNKIVEEIKKFYENK